MVGRVQSSPYTKLGVSQTIAKDAFCRLLRQQSSLKQPEQILSREYEFAETKKREADGFFQDSEEVNHELFLLLVL